MRILMVLLWARLLATALLVAQSGRHSTPPSPASVPEPFIKTAQENKFTTSPVLPDCYSYAVERGDPKTGPSVTLSKLAAGCKVPWHTHSANGQVLFVSGTFELTMKGQQAQIMSQGSYAYVPANHLHEESCLDGCTYYVIREGPAELTGEKESKFLTFLAQAEHLPQAGDVSCGAYTGASCSFPS